METINKRIGDLIEQLKMSTYEFSKKIGNSRADTLYNLLNNENSQPTPKTLNKIKQNFPELNYAWLLTGEGEMFNDGRAVPKPLVPEIIKIPFYEDAIMIGGTQEGAEMSGVSTHNEMIDAGDWFRDATGAMRVHGNSMYPNYPSGCIVAFKQVYDISLLLYGQDYMIETSEYRVIKRIQKAELPNLIQLCSYNNEKDGRDTFVHENFDVPLDKITRIFRILGKVERNESSRIVYNKL